MPLPPPITVEELFSPPVRARATISPDGTRIAYLAPWRNRLNVWVQRIDATDDGRCVTADADRSVMGSDWTGDSRWLLYLQDTKGDENWHVFRADPNETDTPAVDLTPFPGARAFYQLLPGRPGTAIVQMNRRAVELIDVYELDIATGELTVLAENPGNVAAWVVGGAGTVLAMATLAGGDIEIQQWEGAAVGLRRVAVFDGADHPLGLFPFDITPDGTGVWFGSNRGTDHTRLARLDLATGEETEIDSDPALDLDTTGLVVPLLPSPLIQDRRTGELIGVRYQGERRVTRALDARFAAVLENLTKLSDGDLALTSSDDSGQHWVVTYFHDRDPGVTYYYDHGTGESRLLFRPLPHLDPATLAPMTPVTVTARDGLALPSYLTLPVGIEPVGLPMVLVVHGGPWARDSWGFDQTVQLLANRGYAVLQVNFRGSTGFGKAHMQAAVGEFAGSMHDDLVDAVEWAVKEGYADPDRVAIFGGSYGGYAALVGVTFTPDVFAAAIDYVGISNLANFMRTLPAGARPHLAANWHRYVGDPDDPGQEADMLARSPISRVDRIRTPLLVVQGANDVRVVKAESDNIVAALRARGVEVEYMVKDDEGHGFLNPENQIDLHHAVERFLARHLGGRTATG
ncbi:S9 family peptidase [Mycobacterium sp. NPDC050551]|uniref:S9 family peptidase n=1 Tax=Mycobacterium sp. NPDC050551 TaxID=3155407 RepID=UPI00344A7815